MNHDEQRARPIIPPWAYPVVRAWLHRPPEEDTS